MSSSRLVSVVACAVIVLGVAFVTFVVFAGRGQPQPGSAVPDGFVPSPEFLEQVHREREAWKGRTPESAMGTGPGSQAGPPAIPPQPTPEELDREAEAAASADSN